MILTYMLEVKKMRQGAKISAKHQVTIPIEAMHQAGLTAGERVVARAEGPGRVVLEREVDVLAQFSGALTGVFRTGELDVLRDEWD
jgi:bifunctional DNA-binding transcriptional regulator/antitoxin component of YhaV-PrlF toxin-antitoxin module